MSLSGLRMRITSRHILGCITLAGASRALSGCGSADSKADPTGNASSAVSANCNGQVDGLYCGNDGIGGDPMTLYRCTSGSASVEEVCTYNCFVLPPGNNDVCETAAPGVETHQANELVVVGRGQDNQAWYKAWNPGWTNWTQFGGSFTSGFAVDPSGPSPFPSPSPCPSGDVCFMLGGPFVDLFGRGSDGALWNRVFNGSKWGNWTFIGGGLSSAPASTVFSPDGVSTREDVFVRGGDNGLYHIWSDGSLTPHWSAWEGLGGVLRSAPAVVSRAPTLIDVFGPGTDGQLWHRSWDAGWSSWEPLGGLLTSAPAVTSWGLNRMDVFVRGIDKQAYHKWWLNNAWSGWEGLGGQFLSGLGAAAWAPNRIDLFGVGTDRQLYHMAWDGSGWTGWEALGGGFQ